MKLSLTVTAVGAGEFYEPISNEMNEMFHFLSARRLRVMRTKRCSVRRKIHLFLVRCHLSY